MTFEDYIGHLNIIAENHGVYCYELIGALEINRIVVDPKAKKVMVYHEANLDDN